MFKEYLFAMIFLILTDCKNWFARKWERATDIFFIHVWHRRHVFNFQRFRESDNIYDCPCMFCPRTLKSVTEDARPNWRGLHSHKGILSIILFLAASANAASFDSAQVREGFFYDSTIQVRVFVENSDCSKLHFPCLLRVEDGEGFGQGESVNAFGRPGDTLKLACPFRRSQLQARSQTVTLAFYDAAGKTVAVGTAKMGFKDPVPVSLVRSAQTPARVALPFLSRFRADGRAKP